jgi:hypothetical protein
LLPQRASLESSRRGPPCSPLLLFSTSTAPKPPNFKGFKPVFAVVGSAILLYGLICGFVSLPRLLAHDAFVGVRRDALMVSSGTGPALVFPWDDIARIAHADDRLVVHLRDGAPHVIDQKFGPTPVSHIAQKLEYLRRKAAMNLL